MREPDPKIRLEEIRKAIQAESVSYGELAELQDLTEFIEPGDVELLEWAGVPEFPHDTPTNPIERLENAQAALDEALRQHVYSFPVPDEDGNSQRAQQVQSEIENAQAMMGEALSLLREGAGNPPDVAGEMPDPKVILCDDCIDAYRNGIEPGETACEARARGERV